MEPEDGGKNNGRKTLRLFYKGPMLERMELDGKRLESLLSLDGGLVVPTLEQLEKMYKVETYREG